jgi:hypothetical protein
MFELYNTFYYNSYSVFMRLNNAYNCFSMEEALIKLFLEDKFLFNVIRLYFFTI